MGLTHLIDTSVLKRLGTAVVRNRVEQMALRGELATVSISELEVGFSARTATEWDDLVGSLNAFHRMATTREHVSRALQVQRLLAARSQPGRKLPDLLIAAAAEQAQLIVLHYDADFDRIAAVTGQPCEWVVQAGSID